MTDLIKRKGRIKVSGELLFNDPEETVLKGLFSVFFPIAIEPDHSLGWNRDNVYYGYSMLFEEISEGQLIPTYDIMMQRNEDESIFVSVTKL